MFCNRFLILVACTLALLLAGCASKPIVDTAGVDPQQYQWDLEDCEKLAQQVNTGEAMAASAGIGALIGAAFGLVTGDSDAIRYGAAWGAISGGSSTGLGAAREKSMVMKNCLYNRGYVVLN